MVILLIIILGLIALAGIAGYSDVMGKRAIAAGPGGELKERIATLERRLAELEQGTADRDETIHRLKGEVSFLTNLLGKGTEPAGSLPGPR